MTNLLKVEFKRMIKSKSNIVALGISLIITVILAWICISSQVSDTYLSDGSYKILKGLDAIKADTNRQNQIKGEVTEERLLEALNKYKVLKNKYGDNESEGIVNKELSPYKELLTKMLPYSFSDLINRVNNQKTLDLMELSDKDAARFYDQRIKNQKDNFEKNLKLSNAKQNYAENMESKVKKPFYFSPFTGWDNALNFLGKVIILIAFLACIIVAPVFSREYRNGSDDIMRCTKCGRKQLATSKLIVANLIVLFVYVICIGVFYITIYINLNTEGLDTSIQFVKAISPVALTFGKAIFIIMIVGLITVLSITNFTLFLSSRSKSSIFIISISTIMIIFPMIASFITRKSSISLSNSLNFLTSILPSGGTRIYSEMILDFNLFQVGDFVVWSPYVILIGGVVTLILFLILSMYSYSKYESI